MGLDSYFFEKNDLYSKNEYEIGYFRKFHLLNNFIYDEIFSKKYATKETTMDDMNCKYVPINKGAFKKLVRFAKSLLKDDYAREYYEEDIKTLEEVLPLIDHVLASNNKVYYVGWW